MWCVKKAEHNDDKEPGVPYTTCTSESLHLPLSPAREKTREERLQKFLAGPALNQRSCFFGSRQLINVLCQIYTCF